MERSWNFSGPEPDYLGSPLATFTVIYYPSLYEAYVASPTECTESLFLPTHRLGTSTEYLQSIAEISLISLDLST